MSVSLSPVNGAAAQFLDNNGNPLSGGKLFTYEAGTTTPQATYTTSAGNVAHANPIILDSAGRIPGGELWLLVNVSYKFRLENSAGTLLWTVDDVPGSGTTDGVDFSAGLVTATGAGSARTLADHLRTLPDSVITATGADTARSLADHVADLRSVFNWLTAAEKADTQLSTPLLDHTTSIQAALDETGGRVYFPAGKYRATGLTTSAQLVLVGESTDSVELANYTDGGTILTMNQSGVSDKERRNWTYIAGMTIKDTAAGTGNGVLLSGVLCAIIDRCYFRDFIVNRGLYCTEGLWIYLNYVNSDQSELGFFSSTTPHNNNVIAIRGGELRNPTDSRSALYIENADVVSLEDVAIEGNAGGTSYVSGAILRNIQQLKIKQAYFEVLQSATSGALVLDNCQEVDISGSLLNSNSDAVPSVLMNNATRRVKFSTCRFSGKCLDANGTVGSVGFEDCSFDGAINIAEGVHYTMTRCGPITSVGIPVVPSFQPDNTTSKEPFKNWFDDSCMVGGAITNTIIAGAPVTSHVTSDGYTDLFCTSIAGVDGDKVRTETLGTTDANNDRAIITFMAKATTNQDFTISMFASGFKGTFPINVTGEWRRFFLFANDVAVATAGTGIFCDIQFNGTNTLFIDDVQTVSVPTYAKAGEVIDKFRYIPTRGSRVTAKTEYPYLVHLPYGQATYNPTSLNTGTRATTTVTVPGAALGDFAQVAFSLDTQGINVFGYVSAADTVTAVFENNTGGTIDLASGTLRAMVIKR
jgi:hypothetical protein